MLIFDDFHNILIVHVDLLSELQDIFIVLFDKGLLELCFVKITLVVELVSDLFEITTVSLSHGIQQILLLIDASVGNLSSYLTLLDITLVGNLDL